MNSLIRESRIFLALKIFAVPIWILSSVMTLVLVVGLLSMESETPWDRLVNKVDAAVSEPVYNFLGVVPKKGSVLGQRVDYEDARLLKLYAFLDFYHSPMAESAESFIQAAEKYNLPWNLLPAIACKESGCGRIIPHDSYNAFGWAVYTGKTSGAVFESWDDAINTVAKGLRKNYFDRGYDTVDEIERLYTPPSANSHGGWRESVKFFMSELDNWDISELE